MNDESSDFKKTVADYEQAARQALERGDYVQSFLLFHALVESVLRQFLHETEDKLSFAGLIKKYDEFLQSEEYPIPTFVKELTEFNRRRNRIVHNLWQRGYSITNKLTEPAASGAIILYGLLIEWLDTFNPDIAEYGFQNG